ncbi:hypothetical protein UNDKW_3428 [Undibacterium sp. KW1]|uniref:S53 family peptidase n=1 Tax=Undibacterium sp. KW1 TaxID=2058624 RepID=UPI001331C756|nr:S53 family peptidase [Undibacterium sp. KW1]BBB61701.1 hypothetical protein UNDKW_3428 [Undibacterium sp. KW1]
MIIEKKLFFTIPKPLGLSCLLISASILSACGGDNPQVSQSSIALPPQAVATGTTTLDITVPVLPPDVAAQATQPTFHLAPVLLDPPTDIDAADSSRSAHIPAAAVSMPRELQGVRGRGLTVGAIRSLPRPQLAPPPAGENAQPMAGTSVVSTYTPAQIRAAYSLPALPASTSGLTASQAAQLGAGQTIYIVNANHDPNIVAELNAFNQKFGLPACTVKSIPAGTALPLPAASSNVCEFSVVYSTSGGGMTSATPAYDSGWATEIALDVQWAHATAPLARIILIEAADSSMSNMIGGIKLANAMGPGIVSMSFGAHEGNWTAGVESTFTTAKMTYLAATGDNGPAVEWPAVSPNVVAVGGTSLTYSGTSRTEVAWSNTGGGVSAYTATPSYQNNTVPGVGTPARRTVADVSMNADPNTGQYVAVMTPGSSVVNWVSAGGTSLSTPQWAGVIAIANATLAQAGKPVLGAPHAVLYNKIATTPGSYASSFADVAKGSNGTCASCVAKTGHDQLTGLGTPNVTSLLSTLGGTVIATAPTVTSASISGQVGTALSFTVSATAANPLTYTLSGNPAGMSINSSGIVSWATPVAGTYTVVVTALDAKTGLSGKGTYTIVISAPVPPAISATTINGKAGTALSFNITATSTNPLTYSITGAPSGMTATSAGAATWPTPVAGTYSVTATALDAKTGLSSKAVYTVVIAAATPPVVTAATINGVAATALTFNVTATSGNAMTFSLTGAPTGMTIGSTGTVSWASPVLGTYSVTVNATDSKTGLTGKAVYTVVIAQQPAPVVTAATVNGTVGTALSYTVAVKASNPVTYTLTGAPAGLTISSAGIISWASPVAGNYAVTVLAKDSKTGLSGQAVISISVVASGLSINAPAMTGTAGKALTGSITINAPGATSISISITGAPLGLGFSMSGLSIATSWASPVKGSYTMLITVTDNLGRKATASVPITIN